MKVNGVMDEQRGLSYQWPRLLIMALAVCASCLLDVNIASAAEAIASQAQNNQVQIKHYPVAQIFTFLFLMLGPFKIIGPFAQVTKGADAAFTNRIALLSIVFSSIALLLAAFIGELILSSYGIPIPVLALSGGIILFLVALQSVLQQFTPHDEDTVDTVSKPTMNMSMKMAMTPLAFPAIVTPYGIAALVVFLALSPDLQGRLTIGAIVLAIMLLNLFVMIMTRHIRPIMGILLPILGAVLGVVQVALGLQIINNSLTALGML